MASTDLQFPYGLANQIADFKAIQNASDTAIGLNGYWFNCTVDNYLRLWETFGGVNQSDVYNYTCDTDRYLTIEKSGDVLTCKIYTDSDRLNLDDTLSINLGANHTFRYMYAAASFNTGTVPQGDCDAYDLDLQEAAPTTTDKNIPNYFNSKFITHH